jgi:hypothetical protein
MRRWTARKPLFMLRKRLKGERAGTNRRRAYGKRDHVPEQPATHARGHRPHGLRHHPVFRVGAWLRPVAADYVMIPPGTSAATAEPVQL